MGGAAGGINLGCAVSCREKANELNDAAEAKRATIRELERKQRDLHCTKNKLEADIQHLTTQIGICIFSKCAFYYI